MTAPLLHVDQLSKRFGGFVALDNVDLAVAAGERVGLIGPNGSGKSTLVNCICGTLQNETGSVTFAGEKIDGMIAHERTRRGLARSFQLPRPFASMSVIENIRVPLMFTVNARPGRHLSHAEIDDRCMELLKLVALDEKSAKSSARSHTGRDAQIGAGARHGSRAQAADRRRIHGRPVAFRGRGYRRVADSP